MQRVKTATAVLLALTLLVTAAFLPWLIADLQERRDTGEIFYAAMQEITLNIDNSNLWDSLSVLCRSDLDNYQIDESNARLTREQVISIAAEAMEAYEACGLFFRDIPFGSPAVEITPQLVYPASKPSENGIFWGIFYNGSYDAKDSDYAVVDWTLSIILDDSTGKIVGLEFYDPTVPFAQSDMNAILKAFHQLFFQQLGEPFTAMAVEQAVYETTKYHAYTYFVTDTFQLYLQANPHGFSCMPTD